MDKKMPFSKEQISTANSINPIDFTMSHGYMLENGGRHALYEKQSGGLYFFRDSNKYYHSRHILAADQSILSCSS